MIKNNYFSFLLFCCAFCFCNGQVTIAVQDFESVPATPTLNYSFNTGTFTSVSGNSGGGDRPQNTPQFTSSDTSWSVRNTLIDADFGPTDITAFESVKVEFNLAGFSINATSNGLDVGDNVDVYISLNNGITWSHELEITGFLNARWAFNSGANRTITYDGDNSPTSYSTTNANPIDNVIIDIPDTDATIASNFLVRFIINNNDANESWNIDDITIEGIPSATNTFTEFISTTSTLDEGGLFVDVCVGITNASSSTSTSVQVALNGSGTAINGTDYDDGAALPGAIVFPQTLTFPTNNVANQCLTVFISNDDLLVEGNETIVLDLINPTGGDGAVLGSNTQHTITIVDNEASVIAAVFISEIMYNSLDSDGADDEWIEICNTSGSAQVLNDYTIRYNGSPLFTFGSLGSIIADDTCITISLGSNGDGVFNNACPFTPDYGIDALTNDTNNLINDAATVSIVASDGSTVIDVVSYDDNDSNLTDGNGASFHVIDDSLDNSNTNTNWQAVIDGGSPGINSIVSPCSSLQPEINIEGNLGNFPNISDNDITPSFLDNTRFSDRVFGTDQTKSFRIQNIGTASLTVSDIEILGANAGDFSLTLPLALPFVIPQNEIIVFDITFAPGVAGERNATVTITNDDPTDNENIFEYAIRGTGICNASANVLSPLTGPVNTVVTIIGTDLVGPTVVEFNGAIIPHVVISSTEIEITIPANSVSGNINVTDNIGCVSSDLFTLIDAFIGSCEGSGGTIPTDLFISEVTDASTGGLSYIEIYNGTGIDQNINDYSIQFFNNGSAVENGGFISLNNVILASGNTYSVAVINGSSVCTGVPNSGGGLADQNAGFGGVNFDFESDDHIRLYNGIVHIDSWGTYLSNTWADTLHIGTEGVVFRRNNASTTLPNTVFNVADWRYINWNSCSENDYSNIGIFDFSTGIPPIVNLQPDNAIFACEFSASFTVDGTEGFNGPTPADTQDLEYRWFFNAPGSTNWLEILPVDTNYTGQQTATLNVVDTFNLNRYQYYCQIRESSNTCFTASSAAFLNVFKSVWDGTNWSTPPANDRVVIIEGDFNTSIGANIQTSFESCSLIINSGILTIANGDYVEVINDVVLENSTGIIVETQGAFIQRGVGANAGIFTLNGAASSQVNKLTAPLTNSFDYTYWSSPVASADVDIALGFANPNRRFWFNASNYLDLNNDDIDDNGDAWTLATGSGLMIVGRGYAATHSDIGFVSGNQYQYNFEGALNTGDYSHLLAFNNVNSEHWNFVGNPYPSAIDVDQLFLDNTAIKDVVYLWSHFRNPLGINPGNEVLNFNQNDYLVINATMEIGNGSDINGDAVINGLDIPSRSIASGQSFFVSSASNGSIHFNNNMRISGDNLNNEFFRTAQIASNSTPNKLWLNLYSDNGVYSQTGIGYVEGATDAFDGLNYDATRNESYSNAASIYSIIESIENEKFSIQGKAVNSLSIDEIIPLGFLNNIAEPTIFSISALKFEGVFLENNTLYIKDNYLGTIHNLKDSDYNFTSETGEFNTRFEIVFRADALFIDDQFIDAIDLTITELSDGKLEFRIGRNQTITRVKILDITGRLVYDLKGNAPTEVYNLSQLSKTTYIAIVTLSNGQVISKKAIKQH